MGGFFGHLIKIINKRHIRARIAHMTVANKIAFLVAETKTEVFERKSFQEE